METDYQIGDILAVDADWCNQTYYFLIEGDGEFDTGMGFVYPYRCLNNGETGRGNFQNLSTRKMASEQDQEWEVGDIIEESYPHCGDRIIHYLLMEQNPLNKYVFVALDLTHNQVISYSFHPDPEGQAIYRRLA